MSLTPELVDSIFSAINIAEGEVGEGWFEVKDALYDMYPEVKELHDERKRKDKEEWDEQTKARKQIADRVFKTLKTGKPLIPQIVRWHKDDKHDILHKHYSDDICLSVDLFRYHLSDLKKMGLLDEIRTYLKRKGQKTENYWMKDSWETTADEDLWHELTKWGK